MAYASVAQLVEQGTENPRVGGSIPPGGTISGCSSSGRARPCQGRGSEFEPRHPLHFYTIEALPVRALWRHSQVVRQGSAKPSRPGSNPGGASKKQKDLRLDVLLFFWVPAAKGRVQIRPKERAGRGHFFWALGGRRPSGARKGGGVRPCADFKKKPGRLTVVLLGKTVYD